MAKRQMSVSKPMSCRTGASWFRSHIQNGLGFIGTPQARTIYHDIIHEALVAGQGRLPGLGGNVPEANGFYLPRRLIRIWLSSLTSQAVDKTVCVLPEKLGLQQQTDPKVVTTFPRWPGRHHPSVNRRWLMVPMSSAVRVSITSRVFKSQSLIHAAAVATGQPLTVMANRQGINRAVVGRLNLVNQALPSGNVQKSIAAVGSGTHQRILVAW